MRVDSTEVIEYDGKSICTVCCELRDELHDLTQDPAETTKLIKSQEHAVVQIVTALHAKILKKVKQNRDPVLAQVTP